MDGGALRCGFVMCVARHSPLFGPRLLGSRLFSPALLFGPTLFRSILVGACVAGGPVCWFGFRPERGRPRRDGDQHTPIWKSVVEGRSVTVRVTIGGRRII